MESLHYDVEIFQTFFQYKRHIMQINAQLCNAHADLTVH